MRSIMSFAALIAAIGFSGCCGTGGSCPLSAHGCKLGNIGKRAATATAVETCSDQSAYVESGDCGCDGTVYSDDGKMEYAPAEGGCGCGGGVMDGGAAACACGGDTVTSVSAPTDCGCGDSGSGYGGGPVVSPMQLSAPAGGGCSSCDGASTQAPGKLRGRLGLGANAEGMGMTMTERGLACNQDGSQPCGLRNAARSLKPKRRSLSEKIGFGSTVEASEEYDLVSDEYVTEYVTECDECSTGTAGRRISHGVISDIRGAHRGHGHGCGRGGCGHSGRLCGACSKIRGLAGIGSGNPYGGAIPHTAQAPGQSGMAPSYAYPYYTTRGPRDFLRDNPPSIGR